MKKIIITLIAGLLVIPTLYADVKISGIVQQEARWSDGKRDMYGKPNSNWLAFTATEKLGNGLSVIGKHQWKIDIENTDHDPTFDSYVGLNSQELGAFRMGRMKSLQKQLSFKYVDLFYGSTNNVTFDDRTSNTMQYDSPKFFDILTIQGSLVQDGSTGQYGTDMWELAAHAAFGPVTASFAHLSDKVLDDEINTIAVRGDIPINTDFTLTLAGAYENYDKNDGTDSQDTFTVAGILKAFNDEVLVSYQDVSGDTVGCNYGRYCNQGDVWTLEGRHHLSKRVAIFANYQDEDNKNSVTGIGLRYKF